MGRSLKAEKLKTEKLKAEAGKRTAADGLSRLPRAVKEKISLAIEDGATWKAVAKIAEAAGLRGVTPQNVTNYRHGAHKDWLARQDRLDAVRRDSERTEALMRHYVENGGSPAEAGLLAAADMMSAALASVGPETYKLLIAENPKAAFRMMQELDRVAKLIGAKQALAAAAPAEDAKEAMSPEDYAAKQREIFGLP